MKDVKGNELQVGDQIVQAYNPHHSAALRYGTIVRFTPKMIEVDFPHDWLEGERTLVRICNNILKLGGPNVQDPIVAT